MPRQALYLARSPDLPPDADAPPAVTLDDAGCYWFLYRYFEGANLQRDRGELVDLHGGGLIEGYQLTRLIRELEQAAEDVLRKPHQWNVLVGWDGRPSPEAEIWKTVTRSEVQEIIAAILKLAHGVSASARLICSGH